MPTLKKLYVGATAAQRAYLGSTLVMDRTSTAAGLGGVLGVPEVRAVFAADRAYLFQDAGATQPVTASGQRVEAWANAAGSDYLLASTGSGLTYQEADGLGWVESAGGGRLETAAPDTWVPDMMLAVACMPTIAGQTFQPLAIARADVASDMNLIQIAPGVPRSGFRGRSYSGDPNVDEESDFLVGLDQAVVVNAVLTAGSGSAIVRIDGSSDRTVKGLHAGHRNDVFSLFGEAGRSPESTAGRVYGAVLAVPKLSAESRSVVDQFLASLSGVHLP